MKQYTNSKGESLPKVICAVVDFEHERLNDSDDRNSLFYAFTWGKSLIFGDSIMVNKDRWNEIDNGNYEDFYIVFPTCKNSRGQELPEEIQVEIVEERLRQGKIERHSKSWYFSWGESVKGKSYWDNLYYNIDYSEPTKSDDTFTQGEIVEVSQNEELWNQREYVSEYKGYYVVFNPSSDGFYPYKYIRKAIQPLELTLPELLTIAEEVKRTKVKLKS